MKSEHFINLHRTPRGFYKKLGHLYLTEAEVLNDPEIQKKMGPSLKRHVSVFDKYTKPYPLPSPVQNQSSTLTQNTETEMDRMLLSPIDEHAHEESKSSLLKDPMFHYVLKI